MVIRERMPMRADLDPLRERLLKAAETVLRGKGWPNVRRFYLENSPWTNSRSRHTIVIGGSPQIGDYAVAEVVIFTEIRDLVRKSMWLLGQKHPRIPKAIYFVLPEDTYAEQRLEVGFTGLGTEAHVVPAPGVRRGWSRPTSYSPKPEYGVYIRVRPAQAKLEVKT